MSLSQENGSSRFLTGSNTNQAVQPQKLAKGLELKIKKLTGEIKLSMV